MVALILNSLRTSVRLSFHPPHQQYPLLGNPQSKLWSSIIHSTCTSKPALINALGFKPQEWMQRAFFSPNYATVAKIVSSSRPPLMSAIVPSTTPNSHSSPRTSRYTTLLGWCRKGIRGQQRNVLPLSTSQNTWWRKQWRRSPCCAFTRKFFSVVPLIWLRSSPPHKYSIRETVNDGEYFETISLIMSLFQEIMLRIDYSNACLGMTDCDVLVLGRSHALWCGADDEVVVRASYLKS